MNLQGLVAGLFGYPDVRKNIGEQGNLTM